MNRSRPAPRIEESESTTQWKLGNVAFTLATALTIPSGNNSIQKNSLGEWFSTQTMQQIDDRKEVLHQLPLSSTTMPFPTVCRTNSEAGQLLDEVAPIVIWHRVQKALCDPRWVFRTVAGIADEIGEDETVVSELLQEHKKELRVAPIVHPVKGTLFTSKQRNRSLRDWIWEIRASIVAPFH